VEQHRLAARQARTAWTPAMRAQFAQQNVWLSFSTPWPMMWQPQ
jgi:hypothetical protein